MENECTFSVHVEGELSEETFVGDFSMRRILAAKDSLRKDQLRREFLGNTNGSAPSDEAFYLAEMLSDLGIHLFKYPSWWKEQEFGANCERNVLTEVYNQFLKKMKEWVDYKEAKKEAGKASIRKQVESEKTEG